MPYKDYQKRLERTRQWRKERSPGYMRWLYQRRVYRFWKAEKLEWVLEQIASGDTKEEPARLARKWLNEVKAKELDVGMFYDHVLDKPINSRAERTKG